MASISFPLSWAAIVGTTHDRICHRKRNFFIFASDSDNHFTKFGSKVETKPRPFLRRELVNGFCFLAGFGSICDRVNAESRIVRLRDVDNQKLQDALRAAVAGDLEYAESLFSELITQDANSSSVWSNRGSVRLSMGKYEEAKNDFTKAIELAPLAPIPFLNRAIVYEVLGKYPEAVADCKSAIVNDPEEYAAWYNLGNINVLMQNYNDAFLAYERASILAPGIAGYRLKQALVLFQLERMEEAKKLIQGLVRKYPNYLEAHAALAAILWSAGDRSRAEEQFTEASLGEPNYKDVRWVRTELQWPPGVVQALENFLTLTLVN